MSRRRILLLALLFLLVLGALIALSARDGGAAGSSLAPGPGGLTGARLYLEKRGAAIALLDEPPTSAALAGKTLVLAAPFQRSFDQESLTAISEHLRRGGRVVYGYSGQLREGHEKELREELGLDEPEAVRGFEPPLSPLAWRRYQAEVFRLAADPQSPLREPLELAAFDGAPRPPSKDARIFYRGGYRAAPLVYEYSQQLGTVLALPSALLSNAELLNAGNAGILELVLSGAGEGLAFDELRHGFAAIEEAAPGARLGWNIFLLQALLLYLAAIWTLGRSFGPAWVEQIPALGSAAAFFEQLGSLHQKYRHHASAARSLVERARALDKQVPAELAERPVKSADDFLRLAREVASHQHSRRSKT